MHTHSHTHTPWSCAQKNSRNIHALNRSPLIQHSESENKKRSDTVDGASDRFIFSFPPQTHTYKHKLRVIPAPSKQHNPIDPEICNIPLTFKLNWKLESQLLASTCMHTDWKANLKFWISTVSWMWTRFARDTAWLKKKKKKSNNNKKTPIS